MSRASRLALRLAAVASLLAVFAGGEAITVRALDLRDGSLTHGPISPREDARIDVSAGAGALIYLTDTAQARPSFSGQVSWVFTPGHVDYSSDGVLVVGCPQSPLVQLVDPCHAFATVYVPKGIGVRVHLANGGRYQVLGNGVDVVSVDRA